SSRLEALHAFGQRPKGAVEGDVLVYAVDGAGLAAADAAFGVALAAVQAAADHILLNGVEGHPKALPHILAAARLDDLIGADRAFFLAVARDTARLGQNMALVSRQGDFLHGLAGVDQAREILGDRVNAL